MDKDGSYRDTFLRAVNVFGGESVLAQRLQVPVEDLARWISGNDKPPPRVVLRLLDMLMEERDKPQFS